MIMNMICFTGNYSNWKPSSQGSLTADSPTQKVGGAAINLFTPVVHQVPLESLHDSFSEEELFDFDRKVRAVVEEPVYIVEPKIDGLSVAIEGVWNSVYVRGSTGATVLWVRMSQKISERFALFR